MPELVTIAAIDDVPFVLERFQAGLPGIRCIATYETAEQFLEDRPAVDVVVLDLGLAGLRPAHESIIQADLAIATVAGLGYKVCIYTEHRRVAVLVTCYRAGALGLVHKAQPTAEIADAIHRVAQGETVVSQKLVGVAEILERRGSLPGLTRAQIEVLAARARGETWPSIASRMHVSVDGAKDRLGRVNHKLRDYLTSTNPADIERELGLAPGDLMDPRL